MRRSKKIFLNPGNRAKIKVKNGDLSFVVSRFEINHEIDPKLSPNTT